MWSVSVFWMKLYTFSQHKYNQIHNFGPLSSRCLMKCMLAMEEKPSSKMRNENKKRKKKISKQKPPYRPYSVSKKFVFDDIALIKLKLNYRICAVLYCLNKSSFVSDFVIKTKQTERQQMWSYQFSGRTTVSCVVVYLFNVKFVDGKQHSFKIHKEKVYLCQWNW